MKRPVPTLVGVVLTILTLVTYYVLTSGISRASQSLTLADSSIDKRKALLGRMLFEDPRLSQTNSVSCSSCHNLKKAGADDRPVSVGVSGRLGTFNSPSVFNSSLNYRQFWDGRALTLTDQIDGPIHNPVEMNTNWSDIITKLKKDPKLVKQFEDVFGEEITQESIVDAIVEFERALISKNSPFDRYLRGDLEALTEVQVEGYQKFRSYGCASCHQGENLGGNMFQKLGIAEPYFDSRKLNKQSDLGRYLITKNEKDKFVFRVPSLRNVEKTGPYFHDGSLPNLKDAIRTMGRFQLGRKLSEEDVNDIEQFLLSLTGERPKILEVDRETH